MIHDRCHRRFSAKGACLAVAALATCAPVAAAPDAAPAVALTAGHPAGIWKAAVPPTPMNGEFDDFDPLGIAAGAKIKADCSLNWTDPDDGRLYCFSSGTSLEVFLEEPQLYIERARRAWRATRPRQR